jgi:hypothetical protein
MVGLGVSNVFIGGIAIVLYEVARSKRRGGASLPAPLTN